MHIRRHRDRIGAPGFAAIVGALLTATIVVVAAGGAGGAHAGIYDSDAPPDWQFIHGSYGPVTANVDVAMTATTTWVCGQASATNGPFTSDDATLARIPIGEDDCVWTTYDGPAHLTDNATAIATRGDKAVYTAGFSKRNASALDLLVVRWNQYGAVRWARTLTGAGARDDVAVDVGIDRKLNVVACGTTTTAAAGKDWVVASWLPGGTRRWVWRYGGSGKVDDAPAELVIDGAGNTYVTGSAMLSGTKKVIVTVKLSPTGKRLWIKTRRGPGDKDAAGSGIALRPGGGVYVCGAWWVAAGLPRAHAMSYSASGSVEVFDQYSYGSHGDSLRDLAVTTAGLIVGVGAADQGMDGIDAVYFVWASNGSRITFSYDGVDYADEEWAAVAADSQGGVCMTGPKGNGGTASSVLTKRLPVGELGARWSYTWQGTDVGANTSTAVAVRGTTYAAVGRSFSPFVYRPFVQIWRY